MSKHLLSIGPITLCPWFWQCPKNVLKTHQHQYFGNVLQNAKHRAHNAMNQTMLFDHPYLLLVVNTTLVMDWHWIWTAMSLDWHMIDNAFVHECLWIDIGLAMDWNRIGSGSGRWWIGTELTPQGYGLATPLGLVWQWIDIRLTQDWHWIYINFIYMWWGLASQLLFVIEIVLTLDWHHIENGLAEYWHMIGLVLILLIQDCHKIYTGLAQDLDSSGTLLTPRFRGLVVYLLY